MGWKSIKDHYKIGHIVQKDKDGNTIIGSRYVQDVIKISPEGLLVDCKENWLIPNINEEFSAIYQAMKSDPETLRSVTLQEDVFEKSLPVFTFDKGKVIYELCEKYGWPNVTHQGNLMYENLYFRDRQSAVDACLKDAEGMVSLYMEYVNDARADLKRKEERLKEWELHLEAAKKNR